MHIHQLKHVEAVVIGAGIYGRYLASKLYDKGVNVVIVAEDDARDFGQSKTGVASLVNQARIHNGYHYPRSITTAMNSVSHYQQFINDFKDAVISDFKQVYAIPKHASLTNSRQFEEFCQRLGVRCDEYKPSFIEKMTIDKSWLTDEVAIDTRKMMSIMIERTSHIPVIKGRIQNITEQRDTFLIDVDTRQSIVANTIFNCSYAGINEVEKEIVTDSSQLTKVKYEACEVALFELPEDVERIGVTVMDGPFVSFMPFTKNLWSLTSVVDTPHFESHSPIYDITNLSSKYDVMKQRLSLYVSDEFLSKMKYVRSEFVVKTIPMSAENDDNRLIHFNQVCKNFLSILSGKLNAIYELDDVVDDYMKGVYTAK